MLYYYKSSSESHSLGLCKPYTIIQTLYDYYIFEKRIPSTVIQDCTSIRVRRVGFGTQFENLPKESHCKNS